MKASIIRITLFGLVCLLLSASHSAVAAEGNISNTEKYAWSENAGWLNFRPADGGVTVHDTYLSGYAWAENLGWIKLGADSGGPYTNSDSSNWGVNRDPSGALSGYAWSENVGWINFNPSHSQVIIDPTTLKFDGYAWAENVGWAHFQNESPEYYVMQEAGAPTVTTQAVSAIGLTTATGNGNITDLGAPNPTAHGVCWSTSVNPTTSGSHTDEGPAATGAFTSSITGLFANTTYYVRAYATNSAGTAYGSDVTFTTLTTAPTVTTTAVSSITSTSASSGGNVISDGGASVTARGVCWSTSANPTTSDSKTEDGTGTGLFTSSITGLLANTTYHVRAYATNTAGTAYGSDVTFTTSTTAPTVTTTAVSSITSTSASSGGNVISDGGASVTARGVCWSTSANPTTSDSKTEDGTGTGLFTSSITGLFANTTYHIRTYATNSAGTAYGTEMSFTTSNDGTGVPSGTQDAGPNGGDGNGDGIMDSKQTTVASLPSATGEGYLTIEITGCDQIEQVQAYTYESVGVGDPDYSYPFGLLGFEIPCSSATVKIYYHCAGSLGGYTYRKYGPTPADWGTSLWYTMPGATFGTEEIGGVTVPYAEFDLTESELGDDTNGSPIIDQGGPAQQGGPTAVPTLNEWGMIILSLLMAISAFIVIQRRQQA